MENISELYYEKLKTATNTGQLLAEFYGDVTGKTAGRAELIMINKLVKLYSRFNVFFSILELARYEDKIVGTPYPLLLTICRTRFEREHPDATNPSFKSLDKYISALDKEAEKVLSKDIKIPDSSKLGEVNDK